MMEQFLTKRLLAIILLGVSALVLYLFWDRYRKTLVEMDNYHNRYKEFLYYLENTPKGATRKLDRATLERLLTRLRLRVKSIENMGDRYRITLEELPADKLIILVRSIEYYGARVEELDAVDNTGKGRFYTTIVIKI